MISEYQDCLKKKYKKPFYEKCKELGLKVNKNMSIQELCKLYHKKEDISSLSSSSSYENDTATNLIKLCRERGIKLKSYKKDFLVEKLHEYDNSSKSSSSGKKKELQEKSKQELQEKSKKELQEKSKQELQEKSKKQDQSQMIEKSPYELYRENKYTELADYIVKCYT